VSSFDPIAVHINPPHELKLWSFWLRTKWSLGLYFIFDLYKNDVIKKCFQYFAASKTVFVFISLITQFFFMYLFLVWYKVGGHYCLSFSRPCYGFLGKDQNLLNWIQL